MLGIARWKRSCSRQVIFRKRVCGCHAFWRNDRLVQFVKRCSRWSEKILASDPKGCPQGLRWGRGRSGKASTTDLSVIARRATAEQERSHGQNIPLFSKSRCSRKFPTRFGRARVGSCSKIGGGLARYCDTICQTTFILSGSDSVSLRFTVVINLLTTRYRLFFINEFIGQQIRVEGCM